MLIVTGLSGAGKSVALNTLEDMGYYCVDNLPIVLLNTFIKDFAINYDKPIAVAIDSRYSENISKLPQYIKELRENYPIKLLFLTSTNDVLLLRYHETRRPHPIKSNKNYDNDSLPSLIKKEREKLNDLYNLADIAIDTSKYSIYELRDKIKQIFSGTQQSLLLSIQSFGFKFGIPLNADYVFDVRFLPNPHWDINLRSFDGRDKQIVEFMEQFEQCAAFVNDSSAYLQKYLRYFESSGDRAYLTIAVGCTGGKHRSVYVANQLAQNLSAQFSNLQLEHRDLSKY